nr:reverse transcriptase domain-containing protein [Tanacetum cinerariifolium]
MANLTDMLSKFVSSNIASSSGSWALPSNTITNPKEDLKCITTRSGVAYQGPTIPTPSKVVKQGTEVTKYQVQTLSSQSTPPVQPPVIRSETKTLVSEPVVSPNSDERTLFGDHPKQVAKKTWRPRQFLIPCEFPGMDECLALADLGASINLMPLSVWEGLSLPELTPTCMTLKLADRSVSKPIGITKDVSVKVRVFHFPADFMVVDFEPDPRVLLTLGRCFLKIVRALIDVNKGELTLRIENEAITYNLDQTLRYSANYNQMTANKIDVIYEVYSQKVLSFLDTTASGNLTPYDDLIVSTTSLTLTLFGDSDFLLFEEADAFLGPEDDPSSPKFNPFYYDPKGDILLLEAILNSEPLPPLPNHEQYMPSFKKELKVCEAKTVKSSVDEPPEGINPELCTHKILMEEDYKPAVQHQRRVNPKIHDVIKKEVEKLFDAGLIYPISDSPWVSPVHCVPIKGSFTIVENEENELIPTRLVTEWRVCIDYQKLNEATRKYHFPLPFMDQMLERLAGNEYYCFLDGFSGYFQIPIDPRLQEKTTCMLAIFHDMVEKTMEVFMDDFSIFGNSFENCLPRLDKMLQRCEDTNLSLNWEKSHFMVKEGIVLEYKISKKGLRLTEPKSMSFDFAIGAVLGKRNEKHFKPIHYASKTMNDAESNYTTTEKEMLAVVYAFEKFRSYLIMNKSMVHTDYSALKYLFTKKDAKAILLRWVLLIQEFNFKVLDTKGAENLAADHLSRLENPYENVLDPKEINETFPLETLNMVTFRGDSSTPWFADFTNYQAGNFIVKAYKTPIGCTPYKLVYGKACHLPIELDHKPYWALKQANFDLAVAGDHRKVQLNELNELRDHAYENSLIYKEKMKRIYDSKIKNRVFNVGDRVLLFNSKLKIFSGKLKTRWSGPFTIAKVFPYSTVELSQANGPNFKVNGHHVKHYFGGDIPQLDFPDCEVSRALSFCLSFTRASHPQLHFGNPSIQILSTNIFLLAHVINGLRFTQPPFKTSRMMFSSSMRGIFDLIMPAAVVT